MAVMALWVLPGAALAAQLQVRVDDGRQPVAGAVVSLHSSAAAARVQPRPAQMDQQNSQFVPGLLVVPVGSQVEFPNSDNTYHHVYSFSPAKRFELPLYSGQAAPPVHFDTAGVVTLGCNIHDWMVGYVVVLDTPYSATTGDDGRVQLQAPPGQYVLQVWHPRQPPGSKPLRRAVALRASPGQAQVSLALVPATAPAAGRAADPRLRKLQDKLRSLRDEP